MLVRTLTCTLVGATLAGVHATAAADLPARMPVKAVPAATRSWTGFYVGLFAGYGWGRALVSEPFDSNTGFFYNFTGNSYRFDAKGFFGGGTFGYNWQAGSLVYGIEGEGGYLGLKGSVVDPNGTAFGTPDAVTSFKSDAYAALYGRLGSTQGGVWQGRRGGAQRQRLDH